MSRWFKRSTEQQEVIMQSLKKLYAQGAINWKNSDLDTSKSLSSHSEPVIRSGLNIKPGVEPKGILGKK